MAFRERDQIARKTQCRPKSKTNNANYLEFALTYEREKICHKQNKKSVQVTGAIIEVIKCSKV